MRRGSCAGRRDIRGRGVRLPIRLWLLARNIGGAGVVGDLASRPRGLLETIEEQAEPGIQSLRHGA